MRRHGALVGAAALLLLLHCGCAQVTVDDGSVTAGGTYDPCLPPPTGVKVGDPFVFGLAFWPGGTVADWGEVYNATTGAPGLNPCVDLPVLGADGSSIGNYQSYLTQQGVVFGTYMVKVDTISAARQTRAEMDALWRELLKNVDAEDAITVIAFRGQNRSEAHYIRSNVTSLTSGTGIVQQLSLLVSWDRGNFAGFTWYNSGACNGCGGLSGARCVQTPYDPTYQKYTESTCAWSFEECDCKDGLECAAGNCSTTVYVGHRGSDSPGRSMNSGYQIEQINKFSITSFFWELLDGIYDLLGNSGGIGSSGSSTVQSSPLTGATEADLAASQSAQATETS